MKRWINKTSLWEYFHNYMNQLDEKLLAALRRILRPIVRLLIRNNITLQPLIDLLKETYVSVAEQEAGKNTEKATDSQISLMTGVHRKDVKEYRSRKTDREHLPAQRSVGVELIAKWLADPHYIDDDGAPLDLPYSTAASDIPAFCRLAESISKDVHPRTILEDLIRLDLVTHDRLGDTVRLKADAFIPKENWAEKCYYLGHNSGDHLEAAVTNITSPAPLFLDRSVYHDGLSDDSVREIKKLASDSAMKTLRLINKKAFELSEKDKTDASARHRITLGTYFYSGTNDGKKE